MESTGIDTGTDSSARSRRGFRAARGVGLFEWADEDSAVEVGQLGLLVQRTDRPEFVAFDDRVAFRTSSLTSAPSGA